MLLKSPFKPLTEEAKKKLKTSMEALGVEF
jgi:hypothetical protein